MQFLRLAAAALVAFGVRGASAQEQTLFPPPEAGEAIEAPRSASPSGDSANIEMDESSRMLQGSGIPNSPYPAGLAYTMTPQPFRVPYPNRIYYPVSRYVRQCPYYPKGFYWGADWNHRLLGCNPWLIHGDKRFNPYLTQAKIQHHKGSPRRSAAPGPHLGIAPGEYIHGMSPPMAASKSSRRISKITEVTEVVAASKPTSEATPASESEAVESSKPQSSQVKFSEPDAGDQAAPQAQPAAKAASRAGQRTLPKWQRPPVRR